MLKTIRLRGSSALAATMLACFAAGGIASAQSTDASPWSAPAAPPNQVQVMLVRQDFSDCSNSNIKNVDSPLVAGNVTVTRLADGSTSVKVAVTMKPNTTYHFFLKCVRQIGDVKTDDEGVANATFVFATNTAGAVYAFDMYPDGAPPGSKYQSAQVVFK